MAEATYTFPPDFLWGTATSAHQVEGDNKNNDWWDWEQKRDGRVFDDHVSGRRRAGWSGQAGYQAHGGAQQQCIAYPSVGASSREGGIRRLTATADLRRCAEASADDTLPLHQPMWFVHRASPISPWFAACVKAVAARRTCARRGAPSTANVYASLATSSANGRGDGPQRVLPRSQASHARPRCRLFGKPRLQPQAG